MKGIEISIWDDLEKKRFGLTPVIVILQTEFAGIAIYFISQLPNAPIYILISIVAILTSIGNALNIACVPMKYVISSFGISCMVSILIMLYCLI